MLNEADEHGTWLMLKDRCAQHAEDLEGLFQTLWEDPQEQLRGLVPRLASPAGQEQMGTVRDQAQACLEFLRVARGELARLEEGPGRDGLAASRAFRLVMAAQGLQSLAGSFPEIPPIAAAAGASGGVEAFWAWVQQHAAGKLRTFLAYLWNLVAHMATPKSWTLSGDINLGGLFIGGKAGIAIEFGA